jgi:hypothetical protein
VNCNGQCDDREETIKTEKPKSITTQTIAIEQCDQPCSASFQIDVGTTSDKIKARTKQKSKIVAT